MSPPARSLDLQPPENAQQEHTATRETGDGPAAKILLGGLLFVTLLFNVPQFLQKPLHEDPVYYTIQARTILNGGIAYRELMEPNLPGVIWIHMGMYSLFGNSWIALRVLDLALFSVFLGLLARILYKAQARPAVLLALVSAILLYYFSLWRGVHCQRDIWLLVPAMLAVQLRLTQCRRLVKESSTSSIVSAAFLEGACWGMAVWIKPYVVVPAAACVLTSWFLIRRKREILRDAGGLLLGGLVVGGLGLAWLIASGAWPYFWETMLEWNPEYARSGRSLFTLERFLFMSRRLLPWSLVHLLAVPIALIQVARCLKKSEQTDQQPAAGLFSALYLGWLLQAMLLQHLHDYAQLPAILLGVGVVVGLGLRSWPVPVLTTAVLGVALLSSPVLKAPYREAWSASWKPADKAKLQNQLVEVAVPDWEDLERTAEFLESLNVEDGEVHCFHHLYFYDRLEIAPPIRFTYFPFRFECNPSKRAGMLDALRKSRHKLVISDLATQNLSADAFTYDAESKTWKPGDHFPESLKRQYPWSLPVVFQSGTILVHQMGTNR